VPECLKDNKAAKAAGWILLNVYSKRPRGIEAHCSGKKRKSRMNQIEVGVS
jgi:hypothetical protein